MVREDNQVQRTHLSESEELVGKVDVIESGKFSRITLMVDHRMRVDENRYDF